jgi:glycosyltransferase involved in cell wall biosynthesis
VKSTPSSLKRLLKDSKFAVSICRHNSAYLSGLTPQAQKIHTIYNGLDMEKFKAPQNGRRLKNGCCELVAVGRLVPKKGFHVLVEACRLLKEKGLNFRCRLIGDGELYSLLRELIQNYGLEKRLILEGACSQEELIDKHLSAADILVMPCIVAPNGDRDGIPTVLLEAMAMKIPVISTEVAGIPEVIKDGNTGLLVQSGSHEKLAGGILALVENKELAGKFSSEGGAFVKKTFNREKNVKKLANLFSEGAP